MADDTQLLAKVYSISSSQFSSLYGQKSCEVDGIISSRAEVFGGKDQLTLCLINATNFNLKICRPCLLLDIGCRPITEDQLSFLCVTPSNDDNLEEDDNPDGPVILLLRSNVLRKHGIKSGQDVWLQQVSPLALSKVVLKTKPAGHKFDDNLVSYFSEYFRDNRRVVRENGVLSLRRKIEFKDKHPQDGSCSWLLNFDVLKCEPVSQGFVDAQTNIILLKANEECAETETYKESTEVDEELASSINMLSLLVADFTTPLHGIWCDRPQKRCKTAKLKIQVNDWSYLHQSFLDSGCHNKLDINSSHCLYVSLTTLMDIGVQNGSWMKIWVHQSNRAAKTLGLSNNQPANSTSLSTNKQVTEASPNELKIAYHYAQLYAVDYQGSPSCAKTPQILVYQTSDTNQIVHISPLLHFNLINNSSDTSQDINELYLRLIPYSFEKKDTQVSDDKATQPLQNSTPPYAKEAKIALIQTVFVRPGHSFDKILERHFSKPRLLTVGDVFCFPFDGWKYSMSSLPAELDSLSCDNCMVYFKVMKLVCPYSEAVSCLVDVDHTTLYQVSAVQSFVPIMLHPTEDQTEKTSYWDLPIPPGLEVATEELKSVIKPYIRQNVQMMPAVLVTGPQGTGKKTMVIALGRQLGLLTMNINCYDLIGDSVAATEARIFNVFQKAIACRPCILLFRHINVLAKDRDGLEDEPRIASTFQQSISDLQKLSNWPVVVIATSSSSKMSAQVHSCFLHEVKIKTPSEDERRRILEALASTSRVANDVSFRALSKRTAGLVLADFVSLFAKATSVASKRISRHYGCLGNDHTLVKHSRLESYNIDLQNAQLGGGCEMGGFWKDVLRCGPKIVLKDLQDALEEIQSEHSDSIGAPKIPSVSWQDVGGLLDAKTELLDTIQLPLQHPELFASGLRRSGVLLYGPPGTGKTLLAKAVATECSLNFLSVKGPELINMYVGQSEENIRHVFSRAQSASPCVIFFDELDSLAPNRGRSGDSGGVMDRVVSQLLAELDGLHKSCDVFVIGATNRPDLLDPALLRPGRFDKLLYLGISEDHEAQLKILKALTSKFELSSDCDLESISRHCPLNFTGADLYALCSDAMLHAIKRCLQKQQDNDEETDSDVQVNQEDFLEALKGITPSVPEHELQRYQRIRQQFASWD